MSLSVTVPTGHLDAEHAAAYQIKLLGGPPAPGLQQLPPQFCGKPKASEP